MNRTTQQRTFRIISRTAKINALQAVKDLMKEDNAEVIIRPYRENKTAEQRGFWHVLLKIMSDETGYRQDEVKELIKKKLLGTRVIKIGSLEKEVTESSEAQSKLDYSALIEGTYQLAAEAGIALPNPRYRGE